MRFIKSTVCPENGGTVNTDMGNTENEENEVLLLQTVFLWQAPKSQSY